MINFTKQEIEEMLHDKDDSFCMDWAWYTVVPVGHGFAVEEAVYGSFSYHTFTDIEDLIDWLYCELNPNRHEE